MKKRVKKAKPVPSQVGGTPRVNLMPPRVLEQRARRVLQRRWLIGVFLSLVLVVALSGVGFTLRVMADSLLLREERRTQELTTELASLAGTAQTVAERDSLLRYRQEAAANDFSWANLHRDVKAVLPSGVLIQGFDLASGPAPIPDGDPAAAVGVTGRLTLRSVHPSDQKIVIGALRGIPGAHAIDAGDMNHLAEQQTYEFVITFQLDQTRYTNRYTDTANLGAKGGEG